MFVLYDTMILMINVFEYCPRGYIEGGYYSFTRPSTARIITVRVLFEGGSYMRKYGNRTNFVLQRQTIKINTAILLVSAHKNVKSILSSSHQCIVKEKFMFNGARALQHKLSFFLKGQFPCACLSHFHALCLPILLVLQFECFIDILRRNIFKKMKMLLQKV